MTYTLKIKIVCAEVFLQRASSNIEVWDQDTNNPDDLLGKAPADEDGVFRISFSDEQFNGKREGGPEVYFKVYAEETLIYDTRDTVIYSLQNAKELEIVLTIPEEKLKAFANRPKIKAAKLKTKLSQLSTLTEEERAPVAEKLNAFVKEELVRRVGGDTAAVRKVVEALSVDAVTQCEYSIAGLCEEVVIPALAKEEATKTIAENFKPETLRDGQQTIAELAQLDKPIKEHPAFREMARKAKVEELTGTALGDRTLATTLEERLGDPARARGPQWDKLVEEGLIDKTQKKNLQRTFAISTMTGDNYALVEAIGKREKMEKLSDLAAWRKEDWSAALKEVDGETPNDEPEEEYIRKVMSAVERSYPTRFAVERMVVDKKQLKSDLIAVSKHFEAEDVFSARELDFSEVPEAERTALQSSTLHLRAVAQKYRHLQVRDIYLGDESSTKKAERVEARVASLQTFQANNPQLQLTATNLTAKIGSERDMLDWSGIDPEVQLLVQKQLQAEQRVAVLAPDNAARVQLMERGFHDATTISGMSHARFTRLSGLEPAVADHVFVTAQQRKLKTDLHYQALVTLQHNKRLALTVDNTIPQPKTGFKLGEAWGDCPEPDPAEDNSLYTQVFNELQDIDGYDALFGDQNFCACDDCKSIFSPSAYFVDLMRFVDEYITLYSREKEADFCANGAAEHPLYLPNRRPDLWSLPITCENTYEEIPYLQLVNEIKEAFIRKRWNGFTGDVYRELYENFERHHFFDAPKSSAYDEVEILLDHFGTSWYDIHEKTKRGLQQYAYFGIKRFDLFPLRQDIHRYYEQENSFVELPVKTLLRVLDISRDQLDELRRVNALNQVANLEVVAREIDPGIQYEEERLLGITNEWLTRTRRFIQLWRKTGYTILEWELVVDTLFPNESYFSTNNISGVLKQTHDFHRIQRKFQLSPEELVGIIDQIPTHSLVTIERTNNLTGERYEEAMPGLLARLFPGKEAFRGSADPMRIDAEGNPLIDASGSQTEDAVKEDKILDALSSLLGVLNIDLATLLELFSWEDPADSGEALIKDDTTPDEEYTINDLSFISLLYRHTLLPQRLGLDAQEWYALLKLNGSDAEGLDEAAKLIDFWEQWSVGPYSFAELWARTQVQREDVESNELVALTEPYTRESFFTPISDFAAALDIEPITAELLLLNIERADPDAISIIPDPRDEDDSVAKFRVLRELKPEDIPELDGASFAFDFEQFEKPADEPTFPTYLKIYPAPVDETDADDPNKVNRDIMWSVLDRLSAEDEDGEPINRGIDLLNAYREQEILRHKTFWGEVSGLSPDTMESYALLYENLYLTDFFGSITALPSGSDNYPAGLKDFVETARQWVALLAPLNLPTASYELIRDHGPNYLGLSGTSLVELSTLDNLEHLVDYASVVHRDAATIEEWLHPMLADLSNSPNDPDRFAAYQGFSQLTGCSLTTAEAFYQEYYGQPIHGFPNPPSLSTLKRLVDHIEIGEQLGLTARQTRLLNKTTYTDHARLADLLTESIRQQAADPEAFSSAYSKLSGKINEQRRDLLCAYLLSLPELGFDDANELYAYFLIDPQMSGCMTISRIVATHLTLQLYVQRVQMGLEKSFNGQFQACLDPMVAEQWAWRKNFQVWVANRKVFVYPERYIEPEWRDDKSPEFEALEEELGQVEMSEAELDKSIISFFRKMEEANNFQYAGSYKERLSYNKEVYHLFGRTGTSPKAFFYRTLEVNYNYQNSLQLTSTKHWNSWKPLGITIESPYVSPLKHDDKIYVFWIQVVSSPKTKMVSGSSETSVMSHKITLKFSCKDQHGTWLQPQEVSNFWGNASDGYNPDKSEGELDRTDLYNLRRNKHRVYPYIRDGKIFIDYLRNEKYLGTFIVNTSQSQAIEYSRDRGYPWGVSLKTNPQKLLIAKEGSSITSVFEVKSSYLTPYARLEDYFYHDTNLTSTGDPVDFTLFSTGDQVINDYHLLGENVDIRIIFNTNDEQLLRLGNNQYLVRVPKLNEFLTKNSQGATQQIQSKRENISLSSSVIKELYDELATGGVQKLLSTESQQVSEDRGIISYSNEDLLVSSYTPLSHLDFKGAMGDYFIELFFHIPFLLADQLSSEGKYLLAQQWIHYVFNPLSSSGTSVWQYIPFSQTSGQEYYSQILSSPEAINLYEKDPFNPHAIARLRPDAYKKVIVRKYIENLLDWADSLFRKFQFETINEAMMLYILAQDILGERPQVLGKCDTATNSSTTFTDIRGSIFEGIQGQQGITSQGEYIDGRDFIITLENRAVSLQQAIGAGSGIEDVELGTVAEYQVSTPLNTMATTINFRTINDTIQVTDGRLVFCVPMDKEVLALWDRVEDRLYKIRHCLNIDGIKQKLSLFAPAIDPRALVAARAAGLSIEDAIASLDAAIPYYRFHYMIEKAKAFNGTVQSFGSALLSALEKKDAEELTLLRSVHEQNIMSLTTEVKTRQIEESKAQLENLTSTKQNTQNRINYYQELISVGLIKEEKEQGKKKKAANIFRQTSNYYSAQSSLAAVIPQAGSPFAMTWGGKQISSSLSAFSQAIGMLAQQKENKAHASSIKASNKRREQEWQHQLTIASQELIAIDQQIGAAQIRLSIAEQDLKIHEQQIEQAKELYDFYKEKFSNLGLYKFLATTLQRLYSSAYNLAFDLAQQAQQCYSFETGHQAPNFIKPDNWDTGHAGLLAGERLAYQLNLMEKAFIEANPRREEVRQSVSLRMIDPGAFLTFRKTGECTFSIPEEVFNLPYPGHYMRRLRTVSITIPCVVGPYTNVPVRFTLLNSKLRTEPNLNVPLTQGPAFANEGLSASSAVNDAGQLELDFRDAKYLPFEGGGAISEWSLQLPSAVKSFDYNTISDVILQLSYTAEYDATLRTDVEAAIAGKIPGTFSRLVSVRQEFPEVWYELEQLAAGQKKQLELPDNLTPYFMAGKSIDEVYKLTIDGSGEIVSERLTYDDPKVELDALLAGEEDVYLELKYA